MCAYVGTCVEEGSMADSHRVGDREPVETRSNDEGQPALRHLAEGILPSIHLPENGKERIVVGWLREGSHTT